MTVYSFRAANPAARRSDVRRPGRAAWLLGAAIPALVASAAPAWADASAPDAPAADAPAADLPPPTPEVPEGQTIVVTGTRAGARAVEKSLVPITVASGADLTGSGKQNLRDALAEVLPSWQVQAGGYQGQQGAGVRGARLRGLDVKDTLILVNGVRRHTTSLFVGDGAPTDLDLIPANAIDHIEILQDGAAAQYGSDAIAGVINIILKKTAYTGGQLSVYYGQYGQSVGDLAHKYGRTKNVQLHQGWKLGNDGFFNVSANLQWQNGTNDYPAFAAADPTQQKSLLYPLLPSGAIDPRETSVSRYRQWMGLPSSRTFSGAFNTEIPLGPDLTFYSNGTYAWRYSSGPGYFRTASNQSKAASTTPSPQDPFANAPYTSGALVFPDGYLPSFDVRENDLQVVAGLKGKFSGWDWNLSTGYGQDYADIYTKNSINVSAGPANWGQRDFYDGRLVIGQLLTQLDVTRKFANGLFGQPLVVSAGFEHRYETYKERAGEPLSYIDGGWFWPAGSGNGTGIDGAGAVHPNLGAQGQAGFSPLQAGSWHRQNFAAYLELNQHLTDRWTVDLSGRFEHYTDFGNAPTGQLSTRYEVSPAFAVRGTFGNGFSAPTLQQEHYTTQGGSYSVDTYPGSPTFGKIVQQFSRTTNAYQSLGQLIGVAYLQPEHSINASAGFVAHPFARTTLTVDGYLIDIRNRIVPVTASAAASPALLALLGAQGLNNINSVTFNINGAHTFTKGVDIRLTHSEPLGDYGNLRLTLDSTENVTSIVNYAAQPAVITNATWATTLRVLGAKLTTYYPRNITSLSAAWEYGKLNARVKVTHWGATEYRGNSAAADQYNAPAFTTDASLSYDVNDRLRFSIGGTNVFDKRPTRLSANGQLNTPPGWLTTVPAWNSYAPFGQDGGFYYGRVDFKW